MRSKLSKAYKTKEDQQAMLFALFIIFLIGVKCYMSFAPSQQIASNQKAKYDKPNTLARKDYSKILQPLIKVAFYY